MGGESLSSYQNKRYVVYSRIIVSVFGFLIWLQVFSLCIENERWNQYDFFHYFGTARIISAGIDPYDIDTSFSYLKNFGYNVWTGIHGITPISAYLFVPLVHFSTKTAWYLFQGILFLAFFSIYLLLNKTFKDRSIFSETCLGLTLFVGLPFYGAMIDAHLQAILLCGLLVGLSLFINGKYRAGSILIGIFSTFKVFTLPLILLPLFCKKYTGFIWALLGALIPWLIIEYQLGNDIFLSWVKQGVPVLSESAKELKNNLSFSNFLSLLSLNDLAIRVITSAIATITLIFIATTKENRSEQRAVRVFAALSCVSLLITPIAWTTYYIFAFPGVYFITSKINNLLLESSIVVGFGLFILIGLNPYLAPLINLLILLFVIIP